MPIPKGVNPDVYNAWWAPYLGNTLQGLGLSQAQYDANPNLFGGASGVMKNVPWEYNNPAKIASFTSSQDQGPQVFDATTFDPLAESSGVGDRSILEWLRENRDQATPQLRAYFDAIDASNARGPDPIPGYFQVTPEMFRGDTEGNTRYLKDMSGVKYDPQYGFIAPESAFGVHSEQGNEGLMGFVLPALLAAFGGAVYSGLGAAGAAEGAAAGAGTAAGTGTAAAGTSGLLIPPAALEGMTAAELASFASSSGMPLSALQAQQALGASNYFVSPESLAQWGGGPEGFNMPISGTEGVNPSYGLGTGQSNVGFDANGMFSQTGQNIGGSMDWLSPDWLSGGLDTGGIGFDASGLFEAGGNIGTALENGTFFGLDPNTISSALGNTIIGDTGFSFAGLVEKYGPTVAKTILGQSASGGNLLGTGLGLLGSYLQGSAASGAANTQANSIVEAARIAADAAKFRPVGVTTRFGQSNFGYDANGNLISAGYNLAPDLKAQQDKLMGATGGLLDQYLGAQQATAPMGVAAQRAMGLGQGYLAADPQAQAAKFLAEQQALIAPWNERQLADLMNTLQQQGRMGLSTGGTSTMGAANPTLEAYYNALKMQDLKLAADATRGGQDYAKFGAGLVGTGGDLLKGMFGTQTEAFRPYSTALGGAEAVEKLGQQPLDLGINIGAKGTAARAQSGALLSEGLTRAAGVQAPANAYSPWAGLLTGAGTAMQGYRFDPMTGKPITWGQ